MKGLVHIPGHAELAAAYGALQTPQAALTIPQWSLWSQWARFDPRLAEQLVGRLATDWISVAPLALRQALTTQPWPAAFGVLTEQVRAFSGLGTTDRRLFKRWSDLALDGFEPAPNEQFFIGTRAFAGEAMRADAEFALKPYRRFGYLGREILINKAPTSLPRTLIPADVRRAILDALVKTRNRITTRDYRNALGGWISPRQAELDLLAHTRLHPVGHTRNRTYEVQRRKKSLGSV